MANSDPLRTLREAAKNADPLLSDPEATEYIGLSAGTLSVWRCTGRYGIPYVKVGRKVFYRRSALDKWLASREVTHTGQADQLVGASV